MLSRRTTGTRVCRPLAAIAAAALCAFSAGAFARAVENTVLTASTDLLVVDTAAQRVTAEIPLGRFVKDIAVSPDGRWAFVAHSGGVEIVSLEEMRVVARPVEIPARVVRLSADGSELYALAYGTPEMRRSGELPDGYLLEVVGLEGAAVRWHRRIELGAGILDMAVVPASGNVYLLDAGARTISERELADGRLKRTLRIPLRGDSAGPGSGVLFRMAVTPDGRRLYIPEMGGESGFWEVDTLTALSRWIPLGFQSFPRGLAMSPDGRSLHVAALDGLFTLDLERRLVSVFADSELIHQGLAVSRDGRRLYSSLPAFKEGGALDILDAGSLVTVGRVALPEHSVFAVAAGN